MTRRAVLTATIAALVLVACARDPDGEKQKFLEMGNEYFAKGKRREASLLYRKAIQLDGRFAEAYYRLGLTYWEDQDFEGVAWTCRRVWELDPDNLDAFLKLAEVHFVALHGPLPMRPQQILESLIELEEQAEQKHPEAFEVLSVKGRLLLEQNLAGEAVPVLRRAHELAPSDELTMLGLAVALARSGKTAESRNLVLNYLETNKSALGAYRFLTDFYIRQGQLENAETLLRSRCDHVNDAESWLGLAEFYRGLGRGEDVAQIIAHILDHPDTFPEGRQLAGDFYLSGGDVDAAIDYYRQGLEQEPGQETAYRERIVRAYLVRGDASRAKSELDLLLKDNPDHPMALEFLVYLCSISDDAEQKAAAIEKLHAALGRLPKNHLFRYYYGKALQAAGKHTEAKTQFRESIRLKPDFLPPKRALMDYYLHNNQFTEVEVLAREILKDFPNDATARLALASALAGLRDYAGSRQELAWLINANRRRGDAVFQLAYVELAERNYSEAERLFRTLTESDPPDPRGFGGLLDVKAALGSVGEARALFDKEIEKQPKNLGLRIRAARRAAALGDIDRVEKYVGRVLEEQPDNPEAHLFQALVVSRTGNQDSAKEHLQRAMKADPPMAMPYFLYGTILLREGQYLESRSYFERGLEIEPENSDALNNLAYALAEAETDLEQATEHAEKAVALDSHNPSYADTLGYVYIKQGRNRDAIKVLSEIVRQHPKKGVFRYHLALAYYQDLDLKRARAELNEAQRGDLPPRYSRPVQLLSRTIAAVQAPPNGPGSNAEAQ